MNRPYIIAIDAIAGGGKSTLSGAVNAALSSSARYCFDDYDEPDIHPTDFYDWWQRGADIAAFDCPTLYQMVSRHIEKKMSVTLFLICLSDASMAGFFT